VDLGKTVSDRQQSAISEKLNIKNKKKLSQKIFLTAKPARLKCHNGIVYTGYRSDGDAK